MTRQQRYLAAGIWLSMLAYIALIGVGIRKLQDPDTGHVTLVRGISP